MEMLEMYAYADIILDIEVVNTLPNSLASVNKMPSVTTGKFVETISSLAS